VNDRKPKLTRTTLEVLEILMTGDEELYGLKIAQAAGLMTGTVYPILARLERYGWVTSAWEAGEPAESPHDKGPRRKFYRLTPTGLQEVRPALDARDEARAHARQKRTAYGF
jgi:DNA-binding PadR family transcriptional regulator